MSLTIGKFTLDNGIMIAPMAGVTDHAFRAICAAHGAEYAVSEMISAKALCYRDAKTAQYARIAEKDPPTALQIFGSEPDVMAEAAGMLEAGSYNACASTAAPVAIDINMGCPMKKIVSNGEGSALMKDPGRVYDIVRAVSSAVLLPVTVKIRAGWDSEHLNAVEVALAAQEGGASLVTVHGRTKEQLYRPPVNYELIAKVKEALKIPVVANGGIESAADALRVKSSTCCDGIMIGQAAQGNPFIFAEVKAAFEGREYKSPSNKELLDTVREHVRLLCAEKGEYTGVREARKHTAWYVRGMRGCAQFRLRVNSASSEAELLALIDDFEKQATDPIGSL